MGIYFFSTKIIALQSQEGLSSDDHFSFLAAPFVSFRTYRIIIYPNIQIPMKLKQKNPPQFNNRGMVKLIVGTSILNNNTISK